jgi:predicted nucleic-acid-binding Zn-ribbon protein
MSFQGDFAEELTKLAKLYADGALSDEEFNALKARVISHASNSQEDASSQEPTAMESLKCPMCGSTEVHAERRGIGDQKGAMGIGFRDKGGFGVGAPIFLKGGVLLTCLDCGYEWEPGENQKVSDSRQQKPGGVWTGGGSCPKCGSDKLIVRKATDFFSGFSHGWRGGLAKNRGHPEAIELHCMKCGNNFMDDKLVGKPVVRGTLDRKKIQKIIDEYSLRGIAASGYKSRRTVMDNLMSAGMTQNEAQKIMLEAEAVKATSPWTGFIKTKPPGWKSTIKIPDHLAND